MESIVPSPPDLVRLMAEHELLIRESAISNSVRDKRGYRSVRSKAELARLGFGKAQCQVPGLLIPVINVHGEVALHQLRPNKPRVVKGKALKYETPAGTRMVLDVHFFAREQVGDPATPLFITEGIRKADAAVSIGLCCIGLLGVWNWRGSNDKGGKVALPDWESVALGKRDVYIVFDSDVMTKPEVHDALARLKAFLESRKAKVCVVYLLAKQDGGKMGLDDFLAAGKGVNDLLVLATTDLRPAAGSAVSDEPSHPYLVHNGRIAVRKETNHGPIVAALCNFSAEIREQLLVDDGEDQSHEFLISGKLDSGQPLPDVRVPSDRFTSLTWIPSAWGTKAVPAAGFGKKDQLREAIQLLSPAVTNRHVFTHTGWRKIDGKQLYLTTGGAPGRDDLEVDLGRGLERYSLPNKPENPAEAVKASLRLLDVAPLAVTATLWAATYRAPLAAFFPIDLSIWMEGQTGSLKSTLAALSLCHWGDFDRRTLPGAWSSTANSLEKMAFVLKDALFVVDDYAPPAWERREWESKASRLLRAQGNLAGRGRLTADLRARKTFEPRGLILSTGEERPPGRSILARVFHIEVDRDQVNLDLLSARQADAHLLKHAMAAYVDWLARQADGLRDHLARAFSDARARAESVGSHLRQPEALAHLWLGLDCGLSFATDIKAIDTGEAGELREKCWENLVERAEAMAGLAEEERPTRRFAEILAVLIQQKKVTLLRRDSTQDKQMEGFIGWFDSSFFYLIPGATYAAVSRFCRDAGDTFPINDQTLRQALVKEKIAEHDDGHRTMPVRFAMGTRRVLRLYRRALSVLIDAEFPDPDGSVTAVTGVTASED